MATGKKNKSSITIVCVLLNAFNLRLYSLPRSVDFINVAIFTFTDFSFSCLADVKGVFHLAQMEEITVRKL
uniref:Uncharacterized protein n=1 Tax=Romanomermis culicivorax TaxID=13658 RepID=A0A915K579_ROMCU